MTDEEERASDARLEHAAARAPPHSVHRLDTRHCVSPFMNRSTASAVCNRVPQKGQK
jgi:hypothetical protein